MSNKSLFVKYTTEISCFNENGVKICHGKSFQFLKSENMTFAVIGHFDT